ncbi:MAG TPA: RpiB/LacA/LacB family sugar-phosphate isomerase [Gaiellaceae bacterium]|jgi:ribose 5-phosphate isomerase B|nr:RpiB/LacA/LacB family sugar-phosphate isomerase [Gaiellaceae bacterium]
MNVAFGSDERTPLTDAVRALLESRGHRVLAVGPVVTDADADGDGDAVGERAKQWAEVGHDVGVVVASGAADTGVLFCWTGTGASIAANKVPGVRAALCTDAATAEGARRWNDANVLVLGLRLTSPELAREMLDAWFATAPDPGEAANITRLDRA